MAILSLLLVLSLAQIHLQTFISILKWLAWPGYRKEDFMNFKKVFIWCCERGMEKLYIVIDSQEKDLNTTRYSYYDSLQFPTPLERRICPN